MNKKLIKDITDELVSYTGERCDSEEPIEISAVQEFLDKGADVNLRLNFSGTTCPVFLGVLFEIEWAEENTPLEIQDLVALFVKHEADLNKKNGRTGTPLAQSLKEYKCYTAMALINQGAKIRKDENLLMLATQIPCRNKEKGEALYGIINKLLEHGYDATELVDNGKTAPIILAAENGQIEVVKELIKRGSDVNGADVKGVTPLMNACGLPPLSKGTAFIQSRPLELITLLVENGANATLKSNQNRDALSIFSKTTYNIEGSYTSDVIKEKIGKLLEKSIETFS